MTHPHDKTEPVPLDREPEMVLRFDKLVTALAEQQAMSDDWWRSEAVAIADFIRRTARAAQGEAVKPFIFIDAGGNTTTTEPERFKAEIDALEGLEFGGVTLPSLLQLFTRSQLEAALRASPPALSAQEARKPAFDEVDLDMIRRGDMLGPRLGERVYQAIVSPALSAQGEGQFKRGDRVTKIKGSSWTGRVCGFYSTSLTPNGIMVESENEPGNVQSYPEAAFRAAPQAKE